MEQSPNDDFEFQSLFCENNTSENRDNEVSADVVAAEERAPSPDTDPDNYDTSLVSLLISELECPVCLQPMVGHLKIPLLCPNGHPCCFSCSARVRRICPTCRVSSFQWIRCLPLENLGSLMVEKGFIQQPDTAEQIREQGNLQGRRRRRSARLERARRHMDLWGRTGRIQQPGRYWREGVVRTHEDVRDDVSDDSGYDDEEDQAEDVLNILLSSMTLGDIFDVFDTGLEIIDEENT